MIEDQSNKKKKETPLFIWFVLGCLVSTCVQKALIELARSGNAADWVVQYSNWIFWGISLLLVGAFVLFGIALRKGQK
jgi:hypothetical protein